MRMWISACLALLLGAASAYAASTINSLPPITPFPLPDPGNPATSNENLWISKGVTGTTDYRITPTQLGYIYQGGTAPSSPFRYQQWWDTSVIPAMLRVYTGTAWAVVGSLDPDTGTWRSPAGGLTPMQFGAVGDGIADDTAAVQAAINAAAALPNGRVSIEGKLYGISSALTAAGTVQIVGSYGGSGQRVVGFGSCATGIRQLTVNITVLLLQGSGSTLRDVCFDAVGLNNTDATKAAVQIGPPTTGINNILVEGNGFEGFCNSIDATGFTGGLQIVETYIIRNFIQPVNNAGCAGIRIGRLSAGGTTTDTHMYNNFISCAFDGGLNASVSNVDGILMTDSGGSFARGNDIVACLHGTKIFPGAIANQAVSGLQFSNTVIGDSSKVNDFLIDTASATGVVNQLKITGSWMSAALQSSVVIQNTGGGTVRGVDFTGSNVYPRQNVNGVDVLAGDDVTFTGNHICAPNVSTGKMLNVTTAGYVGIHNNRIGACDSSVAGYNIGTGILYAPTAAGKIAITGNQINGSPTQDTNLTYSPTVMPTSGVIMNNAGVDDVPIIGVTSAVTTTIPPNPTFAMGGTAAISTINGGWPGRCINVIPSGVWSVVTGGNINPAFTASIGAMKRACFSGSTWYFQ